MDLMAGPVPVGTNPSFLCSRRLPNNNLALYVATRESGVSGFGNIRGFEIDPSTHEVRSISSQPCAGSDPVHVALHPKGNFLAVANYNHPGSPASSSCAIFPVNSDGRLQPACARQRHPGSGPHRRQTCSHAHSCTWSPCGNFLLVPDLGTDEVVVHSLNAQRRSLTRVSDLTGAPGAGPRHLCFHPSGRFVYILNEISSTVTVASWDPDVGELAPLQDISTLPPGCDTRSHAADIHITADGDFLYASNRGHNSLAVFRVDRKRGLISNVEYVASGGVTPRNFFLHPSGTLLLVANQDSDNLVAFKRNTETGSLTHLSTYSVPSPCCVLSINPGVR